MAIEWPYIVEDNFLNKQHFDFLLKFYEQDIKDDSKGISKNKIWLDGNVEGKLSKLAEEVCLCDQKFVKNTDLTINDLINELTLKLGEKISIRRFIKWNLGEGIEKKQDNLAEEVSKMASKQ